MGLRPTTTLSSTDGCLRVPPPRLRRTGRARRPPPLKRRPIDMRLSRFFIDRPIFAAVVSIVFVIVGAVALARLPFAQYPDIAPPLVRVSGQYPGASADVVANT